MIILPERNAPEPTKFLMSVYSSEWMPPSLAAPSCQQHNRTFFEVSARTHDGMTVWRGYYDDRNDFDATLWAVANRRMNYEKPLWKLSNPEYPGLEPDLIYNFVTYVALTTTSTANQTFNIPSDFGSSNVIYAVGGGGSGGNADLSGGPAVGSGGYGGGGGAVAQLVNTTLTPGGTATYRLSPAVTGASGSTASGHPGSSGKSGGPCWFNGASSATATLYAAFGVGGDKGTATLSTAGALGGSSAACVGTNAWSGGRGGFDTYGGLAGIVGLGATGGGAAARISGVAGFDGGGYSSAIAGGGFAGTGGGGQLGAAPLMTGSSGVTVGTSGGFGTGSSGGGAGGSSGPGAAGSSGGGGGGGSGSVTSFGSTAKNGAGGDGALYGEVNGLYGGGGGGGGGGVFYDPFLGSTLGVPAPGGGGALYGGGGGGAAYWADSDEGDYFTSSAGSGGQPLILVSYTASVSVTVVPSDFGPGRIILDKGKMVGY